MKKIDKIQIIKKNELEEFDPFLLGVLKTFIDNNRVSVSLAQRVFSIGFPRAARIIDKLEECGFVSKVDEDTQKRTLLITMEEYSELFE